MTVIGARSSFHGSVLYTVLIKNRGDYASHSDDVVQSQPR
jgi:hypothetical protein